MSGSSLTAFLKEERGLRDPAKLDPDNALVLGMNAKFACVYGCRPTVCILVRLYVCECMCICTCACFA